MFDWITGWFIRWGPLVEQKIIDMVHWAVHAVASVLIAVFAHVLDAWKWYLDTWRVLAHEVVDLAHDVWDFAARLVRVYLPRITRWAWTWIVFLYHLSLKIWHDTLTALAVLRALAWSWIQALWHRVVTDVWDPLKKYADLIWHDLLKWGWVAWWWITHPQNLAGLLFWHIIGWLEHYAWEASKRLGTFGLALVRNNLHRFLILIEDIVAAVF